ncbi:hypothetical protein D3C81_2102920 [compost metagenome]
MPAARASVDSEAAIVSKVVVSRSTKDALSTSVETCVAASEVCSIGAAAVAASGIEASRIVPINSELPINVTFIETSWCLDAGTAAGTLGQYLVAVN